MRKNNYDYIIVGQGLAGSVLSELLIQKNKSVLVIDKANPNTSSRVAAGLFNPITGRRVVKSWMADILLPFAENFYRDQENKFDDRFYHLRDVLEVIHSVKDQNEWSTRMSENGMIQYAGKDAPEDLYRGKLVDFNMLFRITSAGWFDLPKYLNHSRQFLRDNNSLHIGDLDNNKLIIDNKSIRYDEFTSEKIIFCEGYKLLENPLWDWLPLVPAKGEILTIVCLGLPEEFILMSSLFLIPLGNNTFRAGSTFEWNFRDEQTTEEGKNKIVDMLKTLLKIPFTIKDHRAGIRPTVKDRRQIIGIHPVHKNAFIFNGLGTNGVQLAPYFADQFVNYLTGSSTLMEDVDVMRFSKKHFPFS